jgi:hypothetical protein
MMDITITKKGNDTEEKRRQLQVTPLSVDTLRQEKGISHILLFFIFNLPDLRGDTRSRMEGRGAGSSMVRHSLLVG